jgi:hypothetical protein
MDDVVITCSRCGEDVEPLQNLGYARAEPNDWDWRSAIVCPFCGGIVRWTVGPARLIPLPKDGQ